MIIPVVFSVLALLCLILFELKKVDDFRKNTNGKNPLFYIGCFLLAISWVITVKLYWNSDLFCGINVTIRMVIGIILLLISLIFYVYVLFFALPAKTYDADDCQDLVDTGVYGSCRHPGVYACLMVEISLAFISGSREAAILALIQTFFNLVYVILQDHYFFPVYIQGYDEYKKRVPFLLGRKKS